MMIASKLMSLKSKCLVLRKTLTMVGLQFKEQEGTNIDCRSLTLSSAQVSKDGSQKSSQLLANTFVYTFVIL